EALGCALSGRRRFGLRGIVHAEAFRGLWNDSPIICRTPAHPEDEVTSVSSGSVRTRGRSQAARAADHRIGGGRWVVVTELVCGRPTQGLARKRQYLLT